MKKVLFILLFPLAVSGQTIIPSGSEWKSFDEGFEPVGWQDTLFDDSSWQEGDKTSYFLK